MSRPPAPRRDAAPRTPDDGGAAGSERWKERSVWLRVFVYVFVTHLFAGFVMLLFYVGGGQ
ncbi:hypothetical protein H3146_03775 [Streptomyces sp. OF3]|uniref:Small hydrophobic protein n=1 Tax=Streptomyces alkaliterrae TaxID=2213162 RepID=A0A5P0YK77_9ACTN|nr:hypothetical protein [Streptomyces alkaliterrae]MBB1258996.1 hypothetical protein [Streptomyces alkaliterrae]MQS00611.1 hypothetical protein [Streptomyces alkaliterrae]